MTGVLALLPAMGVASCAATVSFDDYGTTRRVEERFFAVRGTIAGLDGTRTTVYLGNLMLDVGDGVFAFPPLVGDGIQWVVTVAETADHSCSVMNGEGQIAGADATGVAIVCLRKAAAK